MKSISLICFYNVKNRYSFNALLASFEENEISSKINLFIPSKVKELLSIINERKDIDEKIIVVFSFFTTQFWEIEEILKKIKKDNNIILIAGGPHPTGDPESTIEIGFDYVLRGEGEELFVEYIKNIIFEIQNERVGVPKKEVLLDKFFPFPRKLIKKFGPIEITRGCPYFCNFCQTSRIFGKKVRHRSIEKICEIVEYMKGENRKDIRFITPNAMAYGSRDGKTVNIDAVKNLLSEIKRVLKDEGRIFFGSFPSEIRPEHVTDETISAIKPYISNDNIVIGAQSGSEKVLKLCNRQHTVKDVYNAVKVAVKFGLIPNVDFIFGLPHEEEEDVIESIKVMKDLIKMGAKIHAHTFMPLPQTPFQYFPPKRISKMIFREFRHLIPKGVIFGNYIEQEKIAFKIHELLMRRREQCR